MIHSRIFGSGFASERVTALAITLIAGSALMIAFTGCVGSVEPRPVEQGAIPNPTAAPIALVFDNTDLSDRHEVAHDARLEWWYHSGHLKSESGREFGFHFVVFKADDGFGEPNLVAQLGFLDVETGEHYEASRAQVGMRGIGDAPMAIGIADWAYGVLPNKGSHSFLAESEEIRLELSFRATTLPMLHNEIGWIPTETGGSYYYSWPRQETGGELTLNGEKFTVTGTSWFDHQWGDFFVLGKPAGWQWFGIQLDDGGSLMITQARGIDGEIASTYGTYMSPVGWVTHLKDEDDGINLAATGEWVSPTSGATYPSGWMLEIESLGMDLVLNPEANDQEVQGGLTSGSTYWEGKVRVSGQHNGYPISGDAYVELSGYADPEPIEWLRR